MRRLPSSHHLKIKFCGNLVRYSFWCTLESRACNSQRGMGNKTGVAANNAMAIKQRPTPPSARPSQPSLDGVSSSLKDIKMMATKYHIEKAIKVHICRVQGPTQAQSRAGGRYPNRNKWANLSGSRALHRGVGVILRRRRHRSVGMCSYSMPILRLWCTVK